MLIIRLSLIFSLVVSNCFAADDTVLLNKGDQAPFAGLLISKDRAESIRIELLERDNLKEENDSYKKSISLYKDITELDQKKISILTDDNDKLAQGLKDATRTTNFERVIYFSLGILATGFAIYGASRLAK